MSELRPYTPQELVHHLGRRIKYQGYQQQIIQVVLTHVLVAGDQGYVTYEHLAQHYTWADTGEPCATAGDDSPARCIAAFTAALQASTELLRKYEEQLYENWSYHQVKTHNDQIAANEVLLGGE